MISIIDYGSGNLGSIQNMFKKIGYDSKIISSPSELNGSSKIILPGVGSFDTGMKNLIDGGWIEILNDLVLVQKIPVLGICLGMQLMCNSSEEGELNGLKWIDAEVKKFNFESTQIKIPHMGWNFCDSTKSSLLLDNHDIVRRFYFVHSYYVSCNSIDDILLQTSYGFNFTSAFEKSNIIGMQFHPEKSHKFGISILKKFAENY